VTGGVRFIMSRRRHHRRPIAVRDHGTLYQYYYYFLFLFFPYINFSGFIHTNDENAIVIIYKDRVAANEVMGGGNQKRNPSHVIYYRTHTRRTIIIIIIIARNERSEDAENAPTDSLSSQRSPTDRGVGPL